LTSRSNRIERDRVGMASTTPPIAVTRHDVEDAAGRLAGRIRRTPVFDLPPGPNGESVSVKLEILQASGSFKIRGATNRIAMDGARGRVTAVSGGNHGAAVAQASRSLGVRADIFLPSDSPQHKRQRIEAEGATLHVVEGTFADAAEECSRFTEDSGALLVHPFNDPGTIAGQGTLGLEVLEQCPDVAKIVVAVGGGGLAAGVAIAVDGAAEVVAAEPTACPSLAEALKAGRPTPVPVGGVASDSLGAPMIGELPFGILSPRVKQLIQVSDEEMVRAQRDVWDDLRLCVEPAAACAWAAAWADGVAVPGERVVIVLCGANADPRAWSSHIAHADE
jgi:threonine dehydratase